jgi:fluoride exporter
MGLGLWLAVAGLGGAGAVARVVGAALVPRRELGTAAVNVFGAFVLGLLTGLSVTGDALLLAGTATLGSLTTFSTWMLEAQRLAEDGEAGAGALLLGGALAAGLAAAGAGWALGSALQ